MGNDKKSMYMSHHGKAGGFILFLAYIGAAIYFVQKSGDGFFDVVLALLQAAVWPVYVIFHVLQNLGA
jgi:hypothetical protein